MVLEGPNEKSLNFLPEKVYEPCAAAAAATATVAVAPAVTLVPVAVTVTDTFYYFVVPKKFHSGTCSETASEAK